MGQAPSTVVVVGAGLAAARAVETLRGDGYDGDVAVVGAEPHLPYERPPLSKDYLQGRAERSSLFVHPEQWYAEQRIDLRLESAVTSIDPGAGIVALVDGSALPWSALLLATGSRPRRLGLAGEELDGVLHLRGLDDSDRLREALRQAQHLAVIGGGWIGLEVAAAARDAGVGVTVLERADLPLGPVLGPEVASVFAELHRDHGVDLRTGVEVTGLVAEGVRVAGVELADGARVPADVVLVAIGARPNTDLATSAGLRVADGIVVDAALRTSAPGVWAAGDVAEAFHPTLGAHVRVEHWDNAREQGVAAARSILGQDVSYDRLPYFYTDQYDLGMEFTGHLGAGYDQVVLRGDVPGRQFVALWLSRGRVVAGMGVNVWDAMDPVRDLVTSHRQVPLERLRDPDVALAEV
jgi:3-phenylpropionate/trans-cinnamate dioxygenase ferredoxin reductase subunit